MGPRRVIPRRSLPRVEGCSLLGAPASPCQEAGWEPEEQKRDPLEELKSSRSVCGENFPDFEMLDAKIASALNKIIPEFSLQEEGQSRGAESPERAPFLYEEDRSPS